MQSYYYPYVDPILMTRNDFLNHPDHFFSYHDGWYLSDDKNERYNFDLKVDADQEILNFGDEFLVSVPIADKPLTAAAIRSAELLADQLIWLCQ